MIELVPYILVLIGWNPANPADSMALSHQLHVSAEACETAGKAFMGEHTRLRAGKAAEQDRYFCIPAPTPADYENMLRNPE